MMPEQEFDRAVHLQVARLSARLEEREGQLSEAEDCYRKLDDLYQAEKSDHAAAFASKVWLQRRSRQTYSLPDIAGQSAALCYALWLWCGCWALHLCRTPLSEGEMVSVLSRSSARASLGAAHAAERARQQQMLQKLDAEVKAAATQREQQARLPQSCILPSQTGSLFRAVKSPRWPTREDLQQLQSHR